MSRRPASLPHRRVAVAHGSEVASNVNARQTGQTGESERSLAAVHAERM